MSDLKVGVFVPQGWRMDLVDVPDPIEKFETMSRCATEAERAGFDSIWVYDHFHTVPTPQLESTFECWTSMAALARDTSTIRLGQLVTCNGYRPPALLAKMASCVDVMSHGRLILSTLSLFFFIPVILVAENAGHVYAISGIMKRDLSPLLGRTFMGDGLATAISGLLGGTGETTYAENIGVMGITKVFSIMVFVVAAVFAILLGFIPIFGALVRSIPVSVQGGITMYLFGLIAVIGGKIWVDARVDFSKRANLAVAAIPLIIAAGIPATQAIPVNIGFTTLTFNNLGLGALTAIVLYQLLRPGHVRDTEQEPAEVVAPK